LNANTGTGLTYVWKKNGSNIGGGTNSSYTATTTGNYTVTVTFGTGCFATSTAVTVTVNSHPTATLTAAGATSFCSGSSLLLNANTGTGLTYQWQNNGTNISGATNDSYSANAAGNYTVVVTNLFNCSETSTGLSVTVNPLPTSVITPAGPTTFACGSNVVLNANTGTGLTYQWQNNGTDIAGSTNSNYTASSPGTYTVVVSNGNCVAVSSGVAVTVTALPTATITPNGPTTFCDGDSVSLNASAVTGFNYQWKNNGNMIAGATLGSYTAKVSGVYTVVVSSGTCSATSLSVAVIVNPVPAAVIATNGTTTICTGGNVTLNAGSANGLTFQWTNNGTNIIGATDSSYNANAIGNYTVMVSTLFCSATSSPVTVAIKPFPAAAKIKIGGATSVCEPGTISYALDMPLGSTTGFGYQWFNNNNPIAGATDSTYIASAINSYSVSVTITGGNTCSKTSSPKTALIKALPFATFTAGGPTTFCTKGSVILSAPANASYTYSWLMNGAPSGAGPSKTVTKSGVYALIAKLSGCVDTSNFSIPVTVNALPVSGINTTSPLTFCQGDSAILHATSDTVGSSYVWYNGSTTIDTTNTPNYTAMATGTYKVMVTDVNGCVSKLSTTNVKLKVNPLPIATITAAGPTSILPTQTVKLTASPSAGVLFQWYKDSVAITGATTKTYTAGAAGSYTVAINKLGCTGYSAPTIITVIPVRTPGIEGLVSDNSFELSAYPNPVTDKLNISVSGVDDVDAEITVIDYAGNLVLSQTMKGVQTAIDFNRFASGAYLIRYKDKTGRTGTLKITKD
jgi:hypothetical protein